MLGDLLPRQRLAWMLLVLLAIYILVVAGKYVASNAQPYCT